MDIGAAHNLQFGIASWSICLFLWYKIHNKCQAVFDIIKLCIMYADYKNEDSKIFPIIDDF